MPDQFDVLPSTLRSTAGSFSRESSSLADELAALRSALSGLGEPWGGDDPGRAFASQYQPNAQALLGNIAVLAEGLGTIRDGLLEMADNYRGSDDASAIPGG